MTVACLRHVGGRAATALCTRATLAALPQLSLRAAPVAALLNLGSLTAGGGLAEPCQQGGPAGAPAASSAWWARSFASSALTRPLLDCGSEAASCSSGSSSSWGGSSLSPAAAAGSNSGGGGGGSRAAGPSPFALSQQRRQHAQAGPLPFQEAAQQQQPATKTSFKVEAAYVGSKINIYDLMHRPEFDRHYKKLHKGTVVLGLTGRVVDPAAETTGMPLDPYMVAFSYGSVVFFNTDKEMKDLYLQVCRDEAADPTPADKPYMEEYAVTVDPAEPFWSRLEADNVTLQQLDLKNIQVISQVLAQSVAMDFYSSHVERTLETFCNMNLQMQETKNITKINKQVLLQMVAENNIVMTDIINKLGVHERYDIAWKHVQYGRIWEFLRAELEMDARFKTLDMKLNLIQDNLKYFLEILQNRKSDTLEWIIIILIGAEICLSLYDLVSKGLGG